MSSGHIIVHASIVAKPEHLEKVREGKSVLVGSRNTEIFPLRRLLELTSLWYTIIRSPSASTFTSIFVSTLVLAIEREYAFTPVVVTNIRDYARKEEEGTLIYRTSISNENERKFEFFEEVSVFLSPFPLSSSLSLSFSIGSALFYRVLYGSVRRRISRGSGGYPSTEIQRRTPSEKGVVTRPERTTSWQKKVLKTSDDQSEP